MRRTPGPFLLFSLSLLICSSPSLAQIKPISGRKEAAAMTVNDVIRLSQAGISDDIIIQQMRNKGQTFDLTTDEILRLKAASVSDSVIRAMVGSTKPATVAGAPTAAQTAGWTTHKDPAGFSIDAPPGWSLAPNAHQGRIVVLGQRGERAIIWPMFIEQRQLDVRGAAALVQQLARKVDSGMPWGAANSVGNVVRSFARGPEQNGAALLTWSSSANGTTLFFYCVEAPADVYRTSTGIFAGILKSFRVLRSPVAKGATPGNAGARQPLRFVNWIDPRENAFTMAVPEGWQVIGGAYRLTATDVRVGVVMVSPDRRVRAMFGDSNLGVFTEPNQLLAFAGLREGQYETIGDGTRLEIRRYLSGQQFARAYVQSYVQRQCAGVQVELNNARPDLATTFLQSARNEGMPYARLTAGDVAFTCQLNGVPMRGSFVVATILPFPGRATLWSVYRLYGYLTAPDRQQEGEEASQRALKSWRINPAWQAQEQQIANSAVQQDNARSQQIQARALQAIREDQQHISDTIMQGYEQRSQVYDEISRRQENAILGTVDVIDPASGSEYKIDNYSDYHWMNYSGDIAGNNTGTSPGPDWRELVTLP
jgi:hypothetical protein